jgi:hypothetical protein
MTRRGIILAALLAVAVLLSVVWPLLPMRGDAGLLTKIPAENHWLKSRDVALSEQEIRWLGGAEGIKRLFSVGGRVWLLAVTDGSRNRQAVHDPTYCFIGEGWKILRQSRIPLAGGSAVLVSMSRHNESSEALLWFFDGGAPFASLPEYWAKSTLRRITLGLSGPEPLLFILRPVGPPPTDWTAAAASVVPLVLPDSGK